MVLHAPGHESTSEMREPNGHTHNPLVRYLKVLGPGLVTGASDDDPGGITTYSVAGASLGYSMLWTAIATFPLMAAVQLICARIGLVSGRGLTGAIAGGMLLDLFGTNPIRMLFWSAVLNGVLAPPLLAMVMLVGNNPKIMGEHTNGFWLNLLGWAATAVMAGAAVAMFVASLT